VVAGSGGGAPGAGFAVGCAHPAADSAAATIPAVTATVINGLITELQGDR
jgi:hypothetical protein